MTESAPVEPTAVENADGYGTNGWMRLGRSFFLTAVWRSLARPAGAIGGVLVVAWFAAAILAPLIAPANPLAQRAGARLLSPGTQGYLLGSDEFGRDLLSRLLYGARISLGISFVAVLAGLCIGVLAGLVSGYLGGWLDSIVMRTCDVVLAYPSILLGVVVVAILGPGTFKIAVTIAIINIPVFARLARSSVISERQRDYVRAAQGLGLSDAYVLRRHILPNSAGAVLVQFTLAISHAVLIEASLSFLGLGAQPPAPSWGAMLSESRPYLTETPLFAILPGVALATLLLGLSLFSDALSKSMSPHESEKASGG